MKILSLKDEQGFTLIEVMAALTITSIVMVALFGFFGAFVKNNIKINTSIVVRNQSILISEKLNTVLENVDAVSNPVGTPDMTAFDTIDKKMTVDSNGATYETDLTQHFELKDGNLYVDSKKINDSNFSLTGTQFYMVNGDLDLNLVVTSKANPNVNIKTNTVYSLGGDLH